MQKVFLDRFQWPLALGILFLVLEFLIHDKRSGLLENSYTWVKRLGIKHLFKKAVLVIFLFSVSPLEASTYGAKKAFEKGDYISSENQYRKEWEKNKDHTELNFNLGDATYKNEKFDEAENLFRRVLTSPDLLLQQKAYYNLGNAQYRLGQQTEKSDQQKTISRWQQAVQSYESALKLNPKDEDATFNLEFVRKKLEELQKQQQKQDQKNQENKQDQNQQDQQQNQNQQQQEQKDKQSQQNQQNKDQKSDQQNQSDQKKQGQQKQEQQKNEQQNSQENQKKEESSSKSEEKQNQQQQNEERRKPGEMSKEEAEQLLNAMKDEQAHPEKLQQVPAGTVQEPDRDW